VKEGIWPIETTVLSGILSLRRCSRIRSARGTTATWISNSRSGGRYRLTPWSSQNAVWSSGLFLCTVYFLWADECQYQIINVSTVKKNQCVRLFTQNGSAIPAHRDPKLAFLRIVKRGSTFTTHIPRKDDGLFDAPQISMCYTMAPNRCYQRGFSHPLKLIFFYRHNCSMHDYCVKNTIWHGWNKWQPQLFNLVHWVLPNSSALASLYKKTSWQIHILGWARFWNLFHIMC
jgi:hypothetical protein